MALIRLPDFDISSNFQPDDVIHIVESGGDNYHTLANNLIESLYLPYTNQLIDPTIDNVQDAVDELATTGSTGATQLPVYLEEVSSVVDITVGSTGDYTTLQEALDNALLYIKNGSQKSFGGAVNIDILEDIELSEEIVIDSDDMSFVSVFTIGSVKVTAAQDFSSNYTDGKKYFFRCVNGGVPPNMPSSTDFESDTYQGIGAFFLEGVAAGSLTNIRKYTRLGGTFKNVKSFATLKSFKGILSVTTTLTTTDDGSLTHLIKAENSDFLLETHGSQVGVANNVYCGKGFDLDNSRMFFEIEPVERGMFGDVDGFGWCIYAKDSHIVANEPVSTSSYSALFLNKTNSVGIEMIRSTLTVGGSRDGSLPGVVDVGTASYLQEGSTLACDVMNATGPQDSTEEGPSPLNLRDNCKVSISGSLNVDARFSNSAIFLSFASSISISSDGGSFDLTADSVVSTSSEFSTGNIPNDGWYPQGIITGF